MDSRGLFEGEEGVGWGRGKGEGEEQRQTSLGLLGKGEVFWAEVIHCVCVLYCTGMVWYRINLSYDDSPWQSSKSQASKDSVRSRNWRTFLCKGILGFSIRF